jgi:hypothetical protein
MRTRLCYLALVLLPLVAYCPTLLTEYGTPEDFLRLRLGAEVTEGDRHGILHGELAEMSHLFAGGVAQLALIRAGALLLVVLTGLALWQMLERSGWTELDAAAVAAGMTLMPAAQIVVGWGTAWPVALAGLLSLAGFAAAESELEQGGAKRFIALAGGILLYFSAALCHLSSATLALVPLAAIGLVRPFRQETETRRWFTRHVALLATGLVGALVLERWLLVDLETSGGSTLAGRLGDFLLRALPEGGALFFAAEGTLQRLLALGVAVAVVFGVVAVVRRQNAQDERTAPIWRLAVLGPVGVFGLIVLFLPQWHGTPLQFWTLSGIALVAVVSAWRVVSERYRRRRWWYYAGLGGFALVGVFVAGGQAHQRIAVPLAEEWSQVRTLVLRANFRGDVVVELKLAPEVQRFPEMPPARFDVLVADHALAAEQMVRAAIAERFSAGLPKGVSVMVRTQPDETKPPTLRLDLRPLRN